MGGGPGCGGSGVWGGGQGSSFSPISAVEVLGRGWGAGLIPSGLKGGLFPRSPRAWGAEGGVCVCLFFPPL